jgi:hypothetical protein
MAKICFSDILARMEECVSGLLRSGNPACISVSETNEILFSCRPERLSIVVAQQLDRMLPGV